MKFLDTLKLRTRADTPYVLNSSLAGFLLLTAGEFALAQGLPIGALAHDGPPTPEQISLVIPVLGQLPLDATASVRYRRSGATQWMNGHPLFRVRPEFASSPSTGSVDDVLAWPIIGLDPGVTYQVEVRVNSDASTEVLSAQFTTRNLPGPAGVASVNVRAGATSNEIQSALDSLGPGDVLEFEDGTYDVNGLEIRRSGSDSQPIYIRGTDRANVTLRGNGAVLRLRNASNVVVEDITLQGPGVDSGTNASSRGIHGNGTTARVTLRNLIITGVDKAIFFFDATSQALVYDNTIVGNNPWTSEFLTNISWNDDGINLPGYGNAVFNNTITGFGDTFAYAQHSGAFGQTETRGVHYYRNEIQNSLDDLVEVDYAHRNITFYDNRSHNSGNCGSLDPLYGGPFVYARNICINPARTTVHKWNATNTGHFYYNSTFITTVTTAGYNADYAGWYQPNNGAQRSYGFRNNILIYGGKGRFLLALESTVHDPIDWTHNSWFPDTEIRWGFPAVNGIQAARNKLAPTTPVFSGSDQRMFNDNATTANPWSTPITLGATSLGEVTDKFIPKLAAGSAPKNSGVVIHNITDGYTGDNPDRGAVISGRGAPVWGDRSASSLASWPAPPTDLTAQ